MNSRERVKAAIGRRQTDRPPYNIHVTGETVDQIKLIHSYGKDVWVHSCGCIDVLLPRLIEMKLDVLNPVQPECMDIARLKAEFGDRITFWGGISTQKTLPFGTPDEVRAECRRVRDMMSRGGGYIYSPAQSIQGDVPVRNIQALLEVAREMG